ncbi:hypothetical protein [[Mycobacterium] nativiensis]|uniref:Uncharacterized protein n=1 Tax=[Mycobacterium] nativiensis TaxID=2855503 RepID=A0ABU5XWD5_9MYCO|nr:hypothetical protein [Mycolicibacter sp. MYC340]MEB3032294.1 hypothetical protein [Mycolicibacter sp. MYC340]
MSTDARGELIKGARPNAGELRSKKSKGAKGIPTQDHTRRQQLIERLKGKK